MGFNNKYRGPLQTVHHAVMADAICVMRCEECHRPRRKWAYRIYEEVGSYVVGMPLGKPIRGFYCTNCKRQVLIVIKVDHYATAYPKGRF